MIQLYCGNPLALKPEIAAAVFGANPPQNLQPVVTSTGVHLIRVEEIIKPQLDDAMRQKIIDDLFATWLAQQVKQFAVEIDSIGNKRSPIRVIFAPTDRYRVRYLHCLELAY